METSEIILDAPVLEKSDARLGTLFLSLSGMTALADFCLWRDNPGLSVGLFAIGAAGIILANRPGFRWTRRTLWLGVLLLATAFENWFINLNLSFWHCLFWVFVIWTALPLLHPSPAPGHRRFWTKELPPLPAPAAERTARLQSAVMLGLLNALFCCVNTLDVIYLWARQTLPANVSYSAFVHEGTASLIIAVVFSAILLAGIFHQVRPVSSWKPLRLLGMLWIAQNLVLLAGMFLRVKLYVDALDLTVIRVNLTFFLLLVTAGFLLLAIRVWWQRPLGWLLHANMLATFFLFYSVQFLDTERFVAGYNVKLWQESGQHRTLDLSYLEALGPSAFDAIGEVARTGPNPGDGADARNFLLNARTDAENSLSKTPWASFQLRARHYQGRLATTAL